MKFINKETDYAIRALLELSKDKNNFLSSKVISENTKIPYSFLRNILKKLILNNLIISKEGKIGGVKINKNPDIISVVDIIKIFRNDLSLSDCMFRNKLCENRQSCVLRKEITRIEEIILDEFSKITIGALIKKLGAKK